MGEGTGAGADGAWVAPMMPTYEAIDLRSKEGQYAVDMMLREWVRSWMVITFNEPRGRRKAKRKGWRRYS